jgi:uncharacterized RDD family membrane protein YckC
MVAFVIDAAIVNGIALVVVGSVSLALSVFGASLDDLPNTLKVVLGVGGWILLNALYFVGSWTLTGQTAGMRAMSIRVERRNGGRLPVWRGLLRLVGIVLAAIPLFAGYLMILVTDRRRGLQDWLAGSVVVFAYDQDVWGGPLRRRLARERKRLETGESVGERRRRLPPSSPQAHVISPQADDAIDGRIGKVSALRS